MLKKLPFLLKIVWNIYFLLLEAMKGKLGYILKIINPPGCYTSGMKEILVCLNQERDAKLGWFENNYLGT